MKKLVKIEQNAQKIRNIEQMATPSELFARIMDDIDEIKTVINKLWTNYAKLEQRFDDYVKNQEALNKTRENISDKHTSNWKWAAATAITVTLFVVSTILNHWPKSP